MTEKELLEFQSEIVFLQLVDKISKCLTLNDFPQSWNKHKVSYVDSMDGWQHIRLPQLNSVWLWALVLQL